MKKLLAVLLLALLLATLPGEAYGKSIKAYFNGQEATVTGILLRQDEPFTIELNITPDSEADAWAEIDEPGTSCAYDRLAGDELKPSAFKRCNTSAGARFRWVLAANGNWVNGTAPVNIYYQINGRNSNEIYASGYFTVVEAYISPGTAVSEPADLTDENRVSTSGPGGILALIALVLSLITRRRSP
jgi:sarcinarray family protein